MSEMSYLEKLLDLSAPSVRQAGDKAGGVGVEWRALGDLVTLRRGRVMSKEYLADNSGKYPVYSSQTANNGEIGRIETFDFDGEFISWTTDGANAGTVFHRTGKFSITNVCGLIKINHEKTLNYKFLFYWLTTEAQKHVYSGMGNPKLMSHQVEKIQIPIPCPDNPKKSLEIQTEIARILDAFTSLTAELTAELTARKKQYNYYRDQLLSFKDSEVEWKTLGELTKITIGEFVRKDKQNPNAEYPVYNGGQAPTGYYEEYNNDGEKIIVSARGASAGFVNKSTTPYWAGNSCYSISVKNRNQLYWLYAYYYLKKSEAKLTGIQQKGGIPAVSKKQMEDFQLPIPPLDKQARIVSILENFDALTNSITEGLPREIELRQKQYAYYRDLLLSFPKPVEVEA
jgi:type I restriction enzyme S subunit